MKRPGIIPPSPDNTINAYEFTVVVLFDPDDKKLRPLVEIENRLGDGIQYMDGVRKVTVEHTDTYHTTEAF